MYIWGMNMNNYETEEFIREKISPKLKEGEQILWCGATASDATRKERGVKHGNYISMAVYFVLLTCLAMKFMDISQYPDKKDIIVPIVFFGLFYLAGICSVISMFVRKIGYYAITNMRLIVITKSGIIRVSMMLKRFRYVRCVESERGIGTLSFVERGNSGKKKGSIKVIGIEDAATVCILAENAIEQAKINNYDGVGWSF